MRFLFFFIVSFLSSQFVHAQTDCTVPSKAGEILGAFAVCQDNNAITLSLANNGEGSIQWLNSIDSINYSVIAGEVAGVLNLTNIQAKQFFRVVVKNGVCPDDTTAAAVINVDSLSLH